MRLQCRMNNTTVEDLQQFSNWILDVGDGKIDEANDGYGAIEIPKELLISDFQDHIAAIVTSTYPYLHERYCDEQFLESRAILDSTIEIVDQINDYVLSLIPG